MNVNEQQESNCSLRIFSKNKRFCLESQPMCIKGAKMFSCSVNKSDDPDREEIRKRKLAHLSECMYEYVQRAQFHRHTDLDEDLLRTKVIEFRDLIQIDQFVPNKSWINHFKATYNISLSNPRITLTRIPPDSLDLKDIITYCDKNKAHNDELIIVPTETQKTNQAGQGATSYDSDGTKTRVEVSRTNKATLKMEALRRTHKISFMERVLYEYLQRATFHQKVVANYDRVRDVTVRLIKILKIDDFFPNRIWLKHFKSRFNFQLSQGVLVNDRTPPSSLDLHDIISYTLDAIEGPPISSTSVDATNYEDPIHMDKDKTNETPQADLQGNMDPHSHKDADTSIHQSNTIKIEKDIPKQNSRLGDVLKPQFEENATVPIPDISNLAEAMNYLRALQDYALLQENFRVVGLLTQVEEVFRNPPNSQDFEET